ncbi:MAG: prepilin-type N-terminal cleavage/methylation domain-containing protein [Candidatus Saccharibacteria bacterium]|nr:prepilin-type N-terminal cleavage/methylation domain-containing protein [Candidatus Saccharibacteria bacterium]
MKKGFTLIELTLSLVFIGVLSVAVVLMINNTISSYRRGMTLNQINTMGMDLVDDMRSAVMNSSSDRVSSLCATYYPNNVNEGKARKDCLADGAYQFVSLTKTARVTVNGEDLGAAVPVYGVFCTGSYSYIWNSGYFFDPEATVSGVGRASLKYALAGSSGEQRAENFKLLKVRDDSRSVCVAAVRKYQPEDGGYVVDEYYTLDFDGLDNELDIMNGYGALAEEPVELITSDKNSDLAVYDIEVAQPAESTTQDNMLYSVAFILGTTKGGVNIRANGKSCKTPAEYGGSNFDYCAINKFNFAVQANGD